MQAFINLGLFEKTYIQEHAKSHPEKSHFVSPKNPVSDSQGSGNPLLGTSEVGEAFEAISKFLIGNRFHVILSIVSSTNYILQYFNVFQALCFAFSSYVQVNKKCSLVEIVSYSASEIHRPSTLARC